MGSAKWKTQRKEWDDIRRTMPEASALEVSQEQLRRMRLRGERALTLDEILEGQENAQP